MNLFTAPTTVILLFLVLATPASAQQNILGKQFWLISDTDAYKQGVSFEYRSLTKELGSDAKWIKVTSDSQPMHYDIKVSTGKTDTIRKDWLDGAVEKKILVDYDPAAKQERQAKAAEAARLKQIRSKTWPAHIEKAAIDRKVLIGMTAEQVTSAWGKPNRINRTVGVWGRHEQWIYGGTYLYFENDVLTSYQESR